MVLAGGFRLELVGAATAPQAQLPQPPLPPAPEPADVPVAAAAPATEAVPELAAAAPVEPPTPPVARPTQAVAARRSGGGPDGHPSGRCRRRRRAPAPDRGAAPAHPATRIPLTSPTPTIPTSRCRRRSRSSARRRLRPRAGRQPGHARRRQDVRQTAIPTRPPSPRAVCAASSWRPVRRRCSMSRGRASAACSSTTVSSSSSTTSCSSAAVPSATVIPARQALRPVTLTGDKVSRSHLEVRFQGWEVLVADCGSTNGHVRRPPSRRAGGGARARTSADRRTGRPSTSARGRSPSSGGERERASLQSSERSRRPSLTGAPFPPPSWNVAPWCTVTTGCASTSSARSPRSSPAGADVRPAGRPAHRRQPPPPPRARTVLVAW